MGWRAEAEATNDPYIADIDEDSSDGETPRAPVDKDKKTSSLLEALAVPPAVQQILLHRRKTDSTLASDGSAHGTPTHGFNATQMPKDGWTTKLRDFTEEVKALRANRRSHHLEVRTFLDLQLFDLDGVAEKQRKTPGSAQLMYMFYSRIFEKLVGKQRGVDVPLFAPIDLNERLLGFRAILEWARDFNVCPARVGRRELERIYATVHPGPEPPLERFASKITYPEFLEFIALCSGGGEPMDRSKLDGSRVRVNEPRLEHVKRLTAFLNFHDSKKVRFDLHNAYRDVHFWKLSDGSNFEKEARAAEMRSRPQWRVEPLPLCRQLDGQRDAAALKYLDQFTWLPGDHTWEEYDEPYLDMGTAIVGAGARRFLLVLTNRGPHLAHLTLEAVGGGPLRIPWRDNTPVSPGQSIEVPIDFMPVETGEWCGRLVTTALWSGGSSQEVVNIPIYARVIQRHAPNAENAARRLPWNMPLPFRPGSANRISIDMASITTRQLRTPTPISSRPNSACGNHRSRPSSASAGCPPRPPSSRTQSGRQSAMQTQRALPTRVPAAARPQSAPLAPLERLPATGPGFIAARQQARSTSRQRCASAGTKTR